MRRLHIAPVGSFWRPIASGVIQLLFFAYGVAGVRPSYSVDVLWLCRAVDKCAVCYVLRAERYDKGLRKRVKENVLQHCMLSISMEFIRHWPTDRSTRVCAVLC